MNCLVRRTNHLVLNMNCLELVVSMSLEVLLMSNRHKQVTKSANEEKVNKYLNFHKNFHKHCGILKMISSSDF